MSQNFELLSQLETELRVPNSAPKVVPKCAKALERSDGTAFSPEFLALAQTVFLSGDDHAPHAVVLCGVDDGGGSGEICINLSRALAAHSSRPVCLIDTSPGAARLERLLNSGRLIPLPDPDENLCRFVEPNLWLAGLDALGSKNGDGLPPTQQLKLRLAGLRTRFDFILMDAPGVNIRGDAFVLGQLSDGAILVIEANSTRKAAALKAKQSLQGTNVRILGSVLNNRTFPIPERLYQIL